MTNFLLKSPDAVFIHIPKVAGTSIRQGAWNRRYEGPVFGYIPDAWSDHFAFAFVRHPLDRLVSAWRMMTHGTFGPPKHRRRRLKSLLRMDRHDRDYKARSSGMPLNAFLVVVMDESIDFDIAPHRGSGIPDDVWARHHAIPQTHPYNCLDKADFVGRYETLEDDFAEVSKRLGGGLTLPHLRQTARRGHWSDDFDAETLETAVEYFRDDFRELGYELPVPART